MSENKQNSNIDNLDEVQKIVEALLMAADIPLSIERLQQLLDMDPKPTVPELRVILDALEKSCEYRAFQLKEVANGWRFQVKPEYNSWVQKLWEERPPRYSRALLEILALIAYRQPITRAEIGQVRGVTVNTAIIKTLSEREWIRVIGHRGDLPGKPALYATTKSFLNYFNLKSLDDLPKLPQLENLEVFAKRLELEGVIQESEQSNAKPAKKSEETSAVINLDTEPEEDNKSGSGGESDNTGSDADTDNTEVEINEGTDPQAIEDEETEDFEAVAEV